jgi:hypothetical protein
MFLFNTSTVEYCEYYLNLLESLESLLDSVMKRIKGSLTWDFVSSGFFSWLSFPQAISIFYQIKWCAVFGLVSPTAAHASVWRVCPTAACAALRNISPIAAYAAFGCVCSMAVCGTYLSYSSLSCLWTCLFYTSLSCFGRVCFTEICAA